jgi:chemotaxis protein MotB
MSDHDPEKEGGASHTSGRFPDAPAPASVPRRASSSGRFERWHLDTAIMPEEDGWLLTYLDVITLLLVMMLVMLAFAGPGKQGVPTPEEVISAVDKPEPEPEPDLMAGLALDGLGKNIEVIVNKGTVSFRIGSEVLFNSAEANLSGPGLGVMSRLVPTLDKAAGYNIVVEGHTDNVPIQTERFPSNWELSTNRAASVVRYLQSQGIDAARMRATGYADTRPIASNDTPQGKAANRHVEVILEAAK